MVGAVISTTAVTIAALANWICSAAPWMTRMRARMVSITAITRWLAAFGVVVWQIGQKLIKQIKSSLRMLMMWATGCIITMQQSKGEYNDRSDTIDNIFDGSPSTLWNWSWYPGEHECKWWNEYANYFFGAFKGICTGKEMCISFMSWLQIQLKWSLTRIGKKKCWQGKKVNRLLMCHKYMFLYHPDMHRPSLNPIEQWLHLKHCAKWTSRGCFRGVKASGPYIEVSGLPPRVSRFVQAVITCWHDEIFEVWNFGVSYHVSLSTFWWK